MKERAVSVPYRRQASAGGPASGPSRSTPFTRMVGDPGNRNAAAWSISATLITVGEKPGVRPPITSLVSSIA